VSYGRSATPVTALSVEFIAKPQETHRLQSAIPAALEETLGEVFGFSGCLVMISRHQARLVTVITFWSGEHHTTRCAASAPWVQKLLAPFMDHCLSVRSLNAYWPREITPSDLLAGQLSVDPPAKREVALSVA
jgi:hypothetical protein